MQEVSDDVAISFGSYQAIFTDVVGMKDAAAKSVPKLQNFRQNYVATTFNDNPDFLKRGITDNQSFPCSRRSLKVNKVTMTSISKL